jgi:hypothetical protein
MIICSRSVHKTLENIDRLSGAPADVLIIRSLSVHRTLDTIGRLSGTTADAMIHAI